MRLLLKASATALAFTAMPANATLMLGNTPCSLTDIVPTATSCAGWYSGNLNGGKPDMLADSAMALNALLGVNTYTSANLKWLEPIPSTSGNSIDFATPLFGDTIFSVHVGGANGSNGIGYSGTAFYRFDAGNLVGGLDSIGLNVGGLSNARLYSTGTYVTSVPEPATWAMMIIGFGAVGAAMRQHRRTSVRYA